MFRVNMVVFWIIINGCYVVAILAVNAVLLPLINGPHFSFVECLATFMSGMVLFKFFFGCLHILTMKIQFNCSTKLTIRKVNLDKEVKEIKKI